ncbi:hypothetical protein GE061_017207, partial [Apolygus lucorum]
DITAHDTRSTMKLLWAAVVVVTLVEAVDKDTFYKMTDFYKFERNPTKKNLFYYLRASSKLYLDYISQLISIFAEVTPEKPEFFAKEKEILNKISQLMTDKNIMKAIDHFYPVSEHEDEEVSLIEIDRWRKVTQAGERFMNTFLDFSHSDYHKHLPLFELVPRPTPKSASLGIQISMPTTIIKTIRTNDKIQIVVEVFGEMVEIETEVVGRLLITLIIEQLISQVVR